MFIPPKQKRRKSWLILIFWILTSVPSHLPNPRTLQSSPKITTNFVNPIEMPNSFTSYSEIKLWIALSSRMTTVSFPLIDPFIFIVLRLSIPTTELTIRIAFISLFSMGVGFHLLLAFFFSSSFPAIITLSYWYLHLWPSTKFSLQQKHNLCYTFAWYSSLKNGREFPSRRKVDEDAFELISALVSLKL